MEKNQKSIITKILMTLALVVTVAVVGGIQTKAAAAAPTGLKQDYDSKTAVGVTWNEVASAEAYAVQISSNSSFTDGITGGTYSNSCTIWNDDWSAIAAGKSYYVRVASIDSTGNIGAYSAPIEVATRPATATKSIKHTKSTTSSVTLNWSAVSGANTYRVYYSKLGSSSEKSVVVNGKTSVTLKGLSKNSEYLVYVYAGRKTAAGYTAYESSGKYKSAIPVTPQKTASVKVRGYYESSGELSLQWKDARCVDGYEVQLYTAYKNKDTKVKSFTKKTTSYYATIKNSNLKKHNFYKVRVRTYCLDSNGKKYYGGWSSWIYTCQQPDVKKMQSTSKGLKVSWDKIKGADRYVIYVSTKQKSGYKKYATTKSTSKVITKCGSSKLKSGKKYYVYVVAQNKVGKKYYSGESNYCWYTTYRK